MAVIYAYKLRVVYLILCVNCYPLIPYILFHVFINIFYYPHTRDDCNYLRSLPNGLSYFKLIIHRRTFT